MEASGLARGSSLAGCPLVPATGPLFSHFPSWLRVRYWPCMSVSQSWETFRNHTTSSAGSFTLIKHTVAVDDGSREGGVGRKCCCGRQGWLPTPRLQTTISGLARSLRNERIVRNWPAQLCDLSGSVGGWGMRCHFLPSWVRYGHPS